MKQEGKKITAAVLYDVTMLRVFERAGVDVVSIGDSFPSYLLGGSMEDVSVDDILLFAKAVIRKAERPVLSIDVPIAVCARGAEAVLEAVRRLKDEAGPDMAKIDIPAGPERLVEEVQAVQQAGLVAYCRLRYRPEHARLDGAQAESEHVLRLGK